LFERKKGKKQHKPRRDEIDLLEEGGGDGGDDGLLGIASTGSVVEESDEAVAISRETDPAGGGVGGSSDQVEGEDLLRSVGSDLEGAGGVGGEGDGDGRERLGVRVVDGVLDGVTSVETEIVGDDRGDGDDLGAVAAVASSGSSSGAWSAVVVVEVAWEATSEGSEPWDVDVTLGDEGADESTSKNLTDWVDDSSRGSEDESGESNVLDGEAGSSGSVPDEEAREWNEGLKSDLADNDGIGVDDVDDDGDGRGETTNINTTGVGEVSGIDSEDFDGNVSTEESHDVVLHNVDTSGGGDRGISQAGGERDESSSESVADAVSATGLDESRRVLRELAEGLSGEWWNSDGVRELASVTVNNVSDDVSCNDSSRTSRDI